MQMEISCSRVGRFNITKIIILPKLTVNLLQSPSKFKRPFFFFGRNWVTDCKMQKKRPIIILSEVQCRVKTHYTNTLFQTLC